MIIRKPNWRAELFAYIASARGKKFRAGRNDCALFSAGAVHAMTGFDPARGLRKYSSLKGGWAMLSEMGFADHVEYAASLFPEIPVLQASVGDLAVIKGADDFAIGVVQGPSIFVLTRQGMGVIPLTQAAKAFRV
ncbi:MULTISPECIES: DUF6950 family protein [Falsihalocynthiibacter]|uniref:DUF6950 family protein n=1 Tax=Falsihalocynthiibacter TaxID=2854182 RepID=UPI0030010A8B